MIEFPPNEILQDLHPLDGGSCRSQQEAARVGVYANDLPRNVDSEIVSKFLGSTGPAGLRRRSRPLVGDEAIPDPPWSRPAAERRGQQGRYAAAAATIEAVDLYRRRPDTAGPAARSRRRRRGPGGPAVMTPTLQRSPGGCRRSSVGAWRTPAAGSSTRWMATRTSTGWSSGLRIAVLWAERVTRTGRYALAGFGRSRRTGDPARPGGDHRRRRRRDVVAYHLAELGWTRHRARRPRGADQRARRSTRPASSASCAAR